MPSKESNTQMTVKEQCEWVEDKLLKSSFNMNAEICSGISFFQYELSLGKRPSKSPHKSRCVAWRSWGLRANCAKL